MHIADIGYRLSCQVIRTLFASRWFWHLETLHFCLRELPVFCFFRQEPQSVHRFTSCTLKDSKREGTKTCRSLKHGTRTRTHITMNAICLKACNDIKWSQQQQDMPEQIPVVFSTTLAACPSSFTSAQKKTEKYQIGGSLPPCVLPNLGTSWCWFTVVRSVPHTAQVFKLDPENPDVPFSRRRFRCCHGKILLTETFETVWVVDGGLPLPRQRNEIRRFDDRIKIVQTKSGINVMAEWRPFI